MTRQERQHLRQEIISCPIRELPPPEQTMVPLCLQTRMPSGMMTVRMAEPVVAVGTRVKVGTLLASDGRALILSPVSGWVEALCPVIHPRIGEVPGVLIRADGDDVWEGPGGGGEGEPASGMDLGGLARQLGIPVELRPGPGRGSKMPVRIDGADRDLFIAIRHRLIVEKGEALLGSLGDLAAALGWVAKRSFVVIGDGHERGLRRRLRQRLGRQGVGLRMCQTDPAGIPGRRDLCAPPLRGRDTSGVWLALEDLEALGIVAQGRPVVHEYVTVSGPGVRAPANLRVRQGTPLRDVLAACKGLKTENSRVILGDSLAGVAQYSLDVPIVRGTRAVIVLEGAPDRGPESGPCIRCGRCLDCCPAGLNPRDLSLLIERDSLSGVRVRRLGDCNECGLCSYVCPARLDLLHLLLVGKQRVGLSPSPAAGPRPANRWARE
jgi:electron transport complex protein RnfC